MELLKKLCRANSCSGNESEVIKIIEKEIKKYVDEVYTDTLGNLIARKKGNGKKLMLSAHADEIGVVVTFIDDDGFCRFSNVGGISQKDLVGRRVVFSNGTSGVIFKEETEKETKISKMYIDIGAKNKEEASKSVSVGDTAAFEGSFYENERRIISKALDNRIGCYALIRTAEKMKSDNDVYFVFSSQEEVGLRGARTAAFKISPDMALAVDVTDTGDTPKAEPMEISLGKGAAIKVMDRSIICHSEVRGLLIELAKKNKIPCQLEVMTHGGTDAGVIHLTKDGIKTGGVSIPVRYIHSPSEMADKSDLENVIDLLVAFCEN